MIKLLASLSIWLTLLLSSNIAYAEEPKCEDDPRACFDGFKPDGTIITRDKKAERTFFFPPVKAGFIIDVYNRDILPHISVEVLEFDTFWSGDIAIDVGVGTSRVFTSLTWEFIPIIKAGPSIWAGYNVREKSQAYGIGFTVLDF
jgi:hypothetical protein